MDEVVASTTSTIESYMDGTVPVLKTRWKRVNDMLLGGLQFGMVYVVAGASGHGKSMFLNNLMRDFTSPVFNSFEKPLKILHFSFEMSAEMELIRRISALSTVGLDKILKADSKLTDIEKSMIYDKLSKIKEPDLYFVEKPGTRMEIAKTIKAFIDNNPNCHYVICLDHTLLVTPLPGENEIQMLAELGKMCIEIRKRFNAMILLVSQLNDKIEGDKRRDPDIPTLHYPMKTDVVPLVNAITRLKELSPYRFKWIATPDAPAVDGFLAHEVSPVVPESIVGEKDAVKADGSIKPQAIDQAKLVPLLVAALQEAVARIEALEAQ